MEANQPHMIEYKRWTHVLGDGNSNYNVFLRAWATHTTGELLIYPDESMQYPLARFMLGQHDSSLVLTENVITVETTDDRCSLVCESERIMREWMTVFRYPLFSPLPINNSKEWKWCDENLSDGKSKSVILGNVSSMSTFSGLTSDQSMLLREAKSRIFLQELQEANRIKALKEEKEKKRLEKIKKHFSDNALEKRRERLLREGREEELNWVDDTKNMYKRLGIVSPTSLATPSHYAQKMNDTETLQEKAARLSKKAVNARQKARNALSDLLISQSFDMSLSTTAAGHDKRLSNSVSISRGAQSKLNESNPIKYNNVLANAKGSKEQIAACLYIQRVWRGYYCRNIHYMMNKYHAAVMIQKTWLLCKYRHEMKRYFYLYQKNHQHILKAMKLKEEANRQLEVAAAIAQRKAVERGKEISCIKIQTIMRQYLKRRSKVANISSQDMCIQNDDRNYNIEHCEKEQKKESDMYEKRKNDEAETVEPCSHGVVQKTEQVSRKVPGRHASSERTTTVKSKESCERKKKKEINLKCGSAHLVENLHDKKEKVRNRMDQTCKSDGKKEKGLLHHQDSKDFSRLSISTKIDINNNTIYNESLHRSSHIHNRNKNGNGKAGNNDAPKHNVGEVTENVDHDINYSDDNSVEYESSTNLDETGIVPSSLPKLRDAVKKVGLERQVVLDIFGVDEENFSSDLIKLSPKPPPRTVQPSVTSPVRKGLRRLLSSESNSFHFFYDDDDDY